MTGLTDEERWKQAVSLALRSPSPAALDRRRRGARRYLLTVGSVLAVCAVVGGLVGWWTAAGSGRAAPAGDASPGWLHRTVFGAAVLLVVVGIVLATRARQWGNAWKAPTMALTRRQRREALRQVRGKAPVVPEHLPVVLDLARRLAATEGAVFIFAGNAVLQLSLVGDRPWPLALVSAAAALAFLVVVGQLLVERRRAQRFLDRHPPSAL